MNFIADLHIHSRFSRATSKQLNPRHLAAWARCKGIDVLGTGDFTHPQWRAELREQMVFDEASGLYRLKGEPEELDFLGGARTRPHEGGKEPLFCLQAEISSIYKRHGKVRKVHNLLFVPSLEDADRLSERLAQIGNLNSDGRPILGLDSRDLLEIMLETVPQGVLVPAHVWTPWFALFGSKSGFDRLEDCFADLSEHVFALETGLSSDPAMNRLISGLDGYALISNSDAHSGANLGREANLFAGPPSYAGMFTALHAAARRESQENLDCRFLGTMEFYPEEGKYHLDGHRACNVVLEPRDALALDNICPVCGKPLTVGVLHRVLELADRETPAQLPLEPEAQPLIPLPEVVGEILGVGSGSRKVQERYSRLLRELGPELDILCHLPEADIRAHWEPLGEAVARMRRGQVIRQGGFDGQYGVVRVFEPEELRDVRGGGQSLPGLERSAARSGRPRKAAATVPAASGSGNGLPLLALAKPAPGKGHETQHTGLSGYAGHAGHSEPAEQPASATLFSEEQNAALNAGPGPVLILAGPGAGKTRVLIGRLQRLLEEGARPQDLLAVTFTRRAAGELRERLSAALPHLSRLPQCDTLHGLAWGELRKAEPHCLLLAEDAAFRLFSAANADQPARRLRTLWDALNLARESRKEPAQGSDLDEAAARMAADTALRMERLLVRLEPVIVLALSVSAGAILLSVMLPLLGGLAAMIIAGATKADDAVKLSATVAFIGAVVCAVVSVIYAVAISGMGANYTEMQYYFDPTLPDVAMRQSEQITGAILAGEHAVAFWLGNVAIGCAVPAVLAALVMTGKIPAEKALAVAVVALVCAVIGTIVWRVLLYEVAVNALIQFKWAL